ncbi:ATP-binding protein [Marinobacterium rhizophilum]|uniref:ATP-binding protein n=1 Tax=Marinobacterium rhizophilum TaxID=420402 RepID=UPI000A02342E|nr:ATP-binding protein [Marinobacterium rhizophilum]
MPFMKSNSQLQLHLQLILPVMLVLAVFGVIVHTVWGPQLLETEKARISEREEDVLRNILPGIENYMLASDFGAIYDLLHQLERTNSDEALRVVLLGTKGELLFPLSPRQDEVKHVDPILLSMPIRVGSEVLGSIQLSIDAHGELMEIDEHVESLERLILMIGAIGLLVLLVLQYLVIGRPIFSLTRAARRIADGDLTTPVPEHAARATGGLGEAFIHMQEQLKKSNLQVERALGQANDNATRYRTVLESIPGALLVINQQGRVEDINHTTEDIFGYSKAEIISQPCLSLFPGDQCAAEMADSFSANPNQTLESEKQGRRKDGGMVPLRLYLRSMCLAGEVKLVVIAIDITQALEAHQELLCAFDRAEKANRAKSEFLSRMSHELRTPLNAIIGFGQLLALDEEMQGDTQRENVAEIVHAGEHLVQLVNEVLDLSRIEEGRIDLDLEPLDIGVSVNKVIGQLRPLIQKRRIEIRLPEFRGDASVIADKGRLTQLFINLLSNAIKYNCEAGRISIDVSVAEEPTRLRVDIVDTGPGIAAQDQSRLFQPFERLESPYDGTEGTGIGLALCKRLVEAMGGNIGVISQPGQGSTFWFELPRAGTEILVSEPIPSLRKVLYVEDNPANMRLMAKLANMRGDVEFLKSTTAEQGLEIAAREPLALILMDINLPGMNGFEALDQLKRIPAIQGTPIVAVTANAMRDDIGRIEASKFDDYLIKPIDIARFNKVMDRYLGSEYSRAEETC